MVSNQQFRLKWNNHRNTVLQEFETLLQNNNFVDCTIGADGKYLKAHKIVLSACSPYLQSIFNEHFDKHPVILLKDVSYKELQCMINYMYCGEVNISECELPSFLRTAQSLKIKGLAEEISDYDSSSEGEPTNSSPSGNDRNAKENLDIPDDEPPAKKSAPSLISANANNSLVGRKRKTPNSVPIAGKPNASNLPKNVSTLNVTANSCVSAEVNDLDNVDESETERIPNASTSTIEHSAEVNTEILSSNSQTSVSLSDSRESKFRDVKEEPVDTDAENEDNSSYEYVNNPCDDSDRLNEDSESNCTNTGKKSGDAGVKNVSYQENDANGLPNLPHFTQSYQFQQSEEVSIYHQQDVVASKNYSKSSLYAIKNGCYGPFYCPQCNNHYMWKKNLLRHMKLECGKEPSFQCPICPLKTKHKSSLIGHIRNKHFMNLKA